MSNVYKTDINSRQEQEKVIKIQPVKRIKKRYTNHNSDPEIEGVPVEEQIIDLRAELEQLEEKRKKLLQRTTEDIDLQKEKWQEEKQTYIDGAQKVGYEQGFYKGEADSLEKYSSLIDKTNELIERATEDYYKTVEQSKETIIELAIHTAEKILHDRLTEDPKAFLQIVDAAIMDIKTDKEIHIYAHPNQFEFLIKQKEELRNSVDGNANLAIYVDKDLQENGCRIEHPFGQVEASIDTQLEQIQGVLQNVNNGE